MLTDRRAAVAWPTVVFLACGFAAANGLSYGGGNHRQYLLHGLHAADPTFLAADWFTTQTRPHHVAFNAFVTWASRLLPVDVVLAALNFVFAAMFAFCVYWLAKRHYQRPVLVTAFTLLFISLLPRSPIALVSMLTNYFQPSTVGAVGLLAGIVLLIQRRWSVAGLVMLIGGAFHVGYVIWVVLLIATVVAVHRREIGRRASVVLMACAAGAALFHLPFFMVSREPQQAAASAQAAHILHDAYMPFHSRPRTWSADRWIQFGALLYAGVLAIVAARRRRLSSIERTILTLVIAVTVSGIALTLIIENDFVATLLPYRIALLLVLAAQVATAGALVSLTTRPERSVGITCLVVFELLGLLSVAGLSGYSLAVVAACATALLLDRIASERSFAVWKWTGILVALGGLAYWLGAGRGWLGLIAVGAAVAWGRRQLSQGAAAGLVRASYGLASIGRVGLALVIAAFITRLAGQRKDLLNEPCPADERLLYEWCRERTPERAIFLVPPDLFGFRFEARRGVVIDYKCMPILPADTLEWGRRMADECGGPVESMDEAKARYQHIDEGRLAMLHGKYGAEFLVLGRGQSRAAPKGITLCYQNPQFVVFDLGVAEGGRAVADGQTDSRHGRD